MADDSQIINIYCLIWKEKIINGNDGNPMLQIKLLLKFLFNKIFRDTAIKNKILRFFGRDYELNDNELRIISEKFDNSLKNGDFLYANAESNSANFIVSLTTFPARIHTLKYTLYSILTQTLHPKKIILSLSREEFANYPLPREITALESCGVEILWNDDNLKQYNKIIPILKKYPNEVIVTLDDDIFYPRDLLSGLWNAHLSNKKAIWAQRARIIAYNNNGVETFFNWKLIKRNDVKYQDSPSFRIFLEGVGGVLYPPYALHINVLDSVKFQSIAPTADDIWLWAMAVLGNSKIGVVKHNLMANGNMMTISPYKQSLWKNNLIYNNNAQMKALLNVYPEIFEILSKGGLR